MGNERNVEQPEGDRQPGAYRGVEAAEQDPRDYGLVKDLAVQTYFRAWSKGMTSPDFNAAGPMITCLPAWRN